MLLIIIFNFVPSINAHSSFFHNQNKTKIKLADYKTLQQEWLTFQPKMKRYDFQVLSKESIPEILKYAGIKSNVIAYDDFNTPSYNSFNDSIFYWHTKDPPEGLIGVYFKPRSNPFNIKYTAVDREYTLEDLLKYEIAIEEAFVFWDAQQKTQDEKVNAELISIDLFVGQSKEEAINNYLIQQKIIQKPKLIKLGCYNITPTTGLIAPLPLGNYLFFEIGAVYFDDGIRLLPEDRKTGYLKDIIELYESKLKYLQTELNQTENEDYKQLLKETIAEMQERLQETYQEIINKQTYTIIDLLKLSNGAKNIYLFTFNTKKREVKIELPDCADPYQAIRDWKRNNNLSNYEGEFIQKLLQLLKGDIEFYNLLESEKGQIIISGKSFQHVNIFETEKEKFIISCADTEPKKQILQNYRTQYAGWLNQCYINCGILYSSGEIRDKFGRSSRTIYDENGNNIQYRYVENPWWQADDWYIDGHNCVGPNNSFNHFYDTTRPPTKPYQLEIELKKL
ncbi:MAG: hypothetical protein ACQBVK_02935 [Candidatus Phytoplasma sp. TWB_XP]